MTSVKNYQKYKQNQKNQMREKPICLHLHKLWLRNSNSNCSCILQVHISHDAERCDEVKELQMGQKYTAQPRRHLLL